MEITLQELLEYHRVMAICEHHGINPLVVKIDHVSVVKMLEELTTEVEINIGFVEVLQPIVLLLPAAVESIDLRDVQALD